MLFGMKDAILPFSVLKRNRLNLITLEHLKIKSSFDKKETIVTTLSIKKIGCVDTQLHLSL